MNALQQILLQNITGLCKHSSVPTCRIFCNCVNGAWGLWPDPVSLSCQSRWSSGERDLMLKQLTLYQSFKLLFYPFRWPKYLDLLARCRTFCEHKVYNLTLLYSCCVVCFLVWLLVIPEALSSLMFSN